jgi:ppGpp synthetase/RelA/SpoT-type nucleotidyltranferase
MPPTVLTNSEKRLIQSLLGTFEENRRQIELFHDQLLIAIRSSANLTESIHSMRSRIKDSGHLKDKLERKLLAAKEQGKPFEISNQNLLTQVNDLVGVRLLHLYTRQISRIDSALRDVFEEGKYELLEGPFARTWDDESRQFFATCKIGTQESPSMYTSVHYVIGSASRTTITAEIQVRTLMEEVWGEVDHTMNYPHPVKSVACREQLKVLARVTSSASRLVDSIFATVDDHKAMEKRALEAKRRSPKKSASAKTSRRG